MATSPAITRVADTGDACELVAPRMAGIGLDEEGYMGIAPSGGVDRGDPFT